MWEEKRLDELGEIGRGKSRHRPRNDARLYGGEFPFVQTSEIQNANFRITEFKTTYSSFGLAQSKLWPSGTLCISIVGANTAATAILGFDACFPDSVIGFNGYQGVANNYFIKYLLDTRREEFYRISQGTARENLSMEKLLSMPLKVPPFLIQQKIASILSTYDDLIENNLKRIQLLEEAAQNLYLEWFVQFRFPATEAGPGYEDAEFVDGLPKGWERKNLIHLCKTISSGGTPSRNKPTYWNSPDFEWIRTKELQDDFIHLAEEYISREGLENSSAKLFPVGTIVMAIYASPTLGRMGILTRDACFNQASVGFIVDEKFISNEFLYYKLLEERINLNNKAIGAAQQNINVQKVKDHDVLLPDKALIDKFTLWVKPLFEQRRKLGEQNLKLKEARDILLPRLMNQTIEV